MLSDAHVHNLHSLLLPFRMSTFKSASLGFPFSANSSLYFSSSRETAAKLRAETKKNRLTHLQRDAVIGVVSSSNGVRNNVVAIEITLPATKAYAFDKAA